jgi:ribonuclease VapC
MWSSRVLPDMTTQRNVVEPVTRLDAESAAELWSPGSGLSLADRLCLATGDRLGSIVWTADSEWGQTDRIRQVR